eukprot:9387467-Alexandrium_andersonii.AAC.1
MVLTTMMVLVRRPDMGSDSVPRALEGPFCVAVRAEHEYGNECPPRSSPRLVLYDCSRLAWRWY